MREIEEFKTSNPEISATIEENQITGKITKEEMKALLYMFTGKTDSINKLFLNPIIIDLEELRCLDEKIRSKLHRENIFFDLPTNVTVVYKNGESNEFGNWNEFLEYDWFISKETESITIKWDFSISHPHYQKIQRHTIVVRLSSGITNVEALKYIFSGTVEDISELEKQAAPVFCRVDFIDAHLGAEIVNIIKEWVDSCKIPSTQKSYINRFQKRKNIIAKGIDFSLPVLTIGLNIGVFEKLLQILDTTIVHTQLRLLAYWIIGSFSAVFVSKQISLFLAKRVFKILDNYGEYSVFELTSGDKKRKSIIESENKVALRNFWLNLFVAFVLNILAGLITAYLIK